MILTQRGWLKYDEIQAGDETIGYNFATGHSEWTPVNEQCLKPVDLPGRARAKEGVPSR